MRFAVWVDTPSTTGTAVVHAPDQDLLVYARAAFALDKLATIPAAVPLIDT